MFSLLSPPYQGSKETLSKIVKPDQDWIVVEQKSTSKKSLNTSNHELDEQSTQDVDGPSITPTRSENHHAVSQPSSGDEDLISTDNTQRTELAATMKAILNSQTHEQEERELFQAQFYAFQVQQEEREARQLDDKEAVREYLEIQFAKRLAESNEKLQCLRVDLDAVERASEANCAMLEMVQKQVDKLQREWELQMTSLVDATAQLRGQVGEMSAQVSDLFATVAQSKIGHDNPSQAGGVVDKCSHSRIVAQPVSRDGGSTHSRGPTSYDSAHGGVRLPPADSVTSQRHNSKRGQYDCEWYIPEP